MKYSNLDRSFCEDAVGRVLNARDEFFTFMKDFTDDLEDLARNSADESWDCLNTYFEEWVYKHVAWPGDVRQTPGRSYQAEGTPAFEEFNQLLPLILLAVIDELGRNPHKLDANPIGPGGSQRPAYRRDPRYLFSSSRFNKATREYDDCIALCMQAPWPSITASD